MEASNSFREGPQESHQKPVPKEEKDRKSIAARWQYLNDYSTDHSEKFRLHLGLVDEFSFLEKMDSVFQKLQHFPKFKMSVSGAANPVIPETDAQLQSEAEAFTSIFRQMFASEGFSRELDLTGTQREQLEDLFVDYDSENERATLRSLGYNPDSGGSLDELRIELRGIRENAADQACTGIKDILHLSQIHNFEQIARRALQKNYGPVFDVLKGDLASRLQWSEQEKSIFLDSAKSALKQFESKLCDIEKEWLEIVFESLEPRSREKLNSLLGRSYLFRSAPSFDVYLGD